MNIVVDESVSYSLSSVLRDAGHTVVAIAESPTSGLSDNEIFKIVIQKHAVLITRDYHFTNVVRFDPAITNGIIYIRRGNLTASDEIKLIQDFLKKHSPEYYSGKLVTLYQNSVKIR